MSPAGAACLLLLSCCAGTLLASDLTMGNTLNAQLVHMETVKLSAVPLSTRNKNVFYNDNATRPIKGISAIDLGTPASKSTARVTAGGVGSAFVNIRLKSERGDPLHYQIRIYV